MPSDADPALDATLAHTPDPDATLAQSREPAAPDTPTVASPSQPAVSAAARRLALPAYELGPLLGRGGMGDVVLGRDRQIGRDVAIKQLRMERPTPDAIARFLREARIQARLEHPAIVPVHQIGHDDQGLPYFTMKKLTGTTLAEQLASPTPPPRQRLLRTFTDVCRAIEFAHARGVVHRDLKPSNIMVGDFGEVYVLDWGLARIMSEREDPTPIGDDVHSLDGMTQAGSMLGTPGYMAPEQIADSRVVGPPADVYALGAILFEILGGEPCHPRGTAALASTIAGVGDGPAQRWPDRHVPPELDALCVAALAPDPARRPSVKALAERLQGYLDGDRDVERRRELARTFVARATAAYHSGDPARRAEAMQAAGRALVLDPESTDAAAIVSALVFEPTHDYPKQLRDELTASEIVVQRRQGKFAMLSFVAGLVYLAIAATNGVRDLPFLLGLVGYTIAHAAMVWRITQRVASARRMLMVAAGNAILVAVLSRTLGSMLIVPAVTCIMALSLTSYPRLIDRKWLVIGLLVASWVVPVALELVGVLTPTWTLDGRTIALTSTVLQIGGLHTTAILIGANVASIVVFGVFASALATSRRDAMRQAEIQAWHLRQLLPTSTR